ncbi:MAG: YkgJ family cysteine cluster protein [Desulfobacteraceae bacterium]
MALDFKEHFAKYEAVVSMVDGVFDKVKNDYPREVFCREKCSDCCYAIFDLTIIEAVYINHKFNEKFSGSKKLELIDEAAKIDRSLYKMKKEAYQETKKGKNEVDVLGMMAAKRVRCPLLGSDDLCMLYEARPITCRLYGIPTSSAGMSHICGRTNFEEGKSYPTVNMDTIYSQLQLISAEFTKAINSRHVKMCEMLVPVSTALITNYNEEYLGVEV